MFGLRAIAGRAFLGMPAMLAGLRQPVVSGCFSRWLHASCQTNHFNTHGVRRLALNYERKGGHQPRELERKTVYGCRRNVKASPFKLNLVAKQIRGLPIDEAIRQLEFSTKKAARYVRQVLLVTKHNARLHHNVEDPSHMYILESYVSKGQYFHGMRYHSRGRGARSDKPRSHYYVKLQEGMPPQKLKIKVDHTTLVQTRLMKRPQKIINSL